MAKSNGKSKPKPEAKSGEKSAKAKRSAGKPAGKLAGAQAGFRGYLDRTRLPVYSLVFVVPLALFYEAAVIVVNKPLIATYGTGQRVTADKFIRDALAQLLESLGVHGAAADPLHYGIMSGIVVILVLLGWQIASRQGWDVTPGTLAGMLGEAVLFAFAWLLLAKFVVNPLLKMTIESEGAPWLYGRAFREIVFSVGAGVYEEFLFRMLLVWLIALVVAGTTGLSWDPSRIVAVAVSAVLFAAHHHMGRLGEPFAWAAFGFRVAAGLFFGLLYYLRGFGVAVGAHAGYDILCYFCIPPDSGFGGPG